MAEVTFRGCCPVDVKDSAGLVTARNQMEKKQLPVTREPPLM